VLPLVPPEGCAIIVTSRISLKIGIRPPITVSGMPDADAVMLLRKVPPSPKTTGCEL